MEFEELLTELRQISRARLSDVIRVGEDGQVQILDGSLPNVKHIRFDKDGRLLTVDMFDIQAALDKLLKLCTQQTASPLRVEDALRRLQGEEF